MFISGKCHEEYQNYQQRIAANNGRLIGGSAPDCSVDGSFKPKQCNPSAASCWCVNIETGVQIPGTEKKTFIANIDCSEYKGKLYYTNSNINTALFLFTAMILLQPFDPLDILILGFRHAYYTNFGVLTCLVL